MNLDLEKYYSLITNHPDAFAYHQIVTDENGNPVDYIFLEINQAFEEMTGLKRTDVIGRKVTEILPDITKSKFDWIGTYGQVALSGKAARFKSFSEPLGRWYAVTAYSDESGGFVALFRDISEQKKNEQALIDNEEKFEAIANYTVNWESWFGPDGKYLWVNPAVEKFTGYSAPEILAMPDFISTIIAEEDRAIFEDRMNEAIGGSQGENFEFQYLHKNGTKRWLSASWQPIFDSKGNFLGARSSGQDITDRKQAEEALHESEIKHRRLFETMSQGVIYQAADGKIISANPACERILGLTFDQMQGKTSMDPRWQMIEEDGTPVSGEEHPSMLALSTGQVVGPVIRGVYRPDKESHVWLRITATPLFQPGVTDPFQSYAVFEDITERKQAEEALKESEALLEDTGFMARVGGWQIDAETMALTWSKETYRIHEIPLDYKPPVDKAIEFFHPDDREVLSQAIQLALSRGEPYDMELQFTTAKGNNLWVRTICRPEVVDGKTVKLRGSFQDITERKQAEEEIRTLNAELEQRVSERTIELAAVNKELVSFAYSVSHDFRAPLRALNAFSANLTEKYSDQLDEQGLHYLDRINKASLYMSDLVDDLLKLSRITRADMNQQEIDISHLTEEILKELQEAEPERRVEVNVAPGLSAKGDSTLLKAAIVNLIDNAWKFSSKEPQAKIEVGRMSKDGEEAFFVRDNGVGFKMAYADKLFGAFQRLHGVNEFPGTGIGLATVQRIINRHGGRIWAESEVGKGATFYFTLK